MTTKLNFHTDAFPPNWAQWRCSSRLCGRPVHFDPRLGKTFWEPVGPPASTWSDLGPRISAWAQELAGTAAAFSIHMAMIGVSKQTATPNVIFCLEDDALRRAILNDKSLKGMLNDTLLPFELFFCPNLPKLLADEAPDFEIPSSASPYGVWTEAPEPRIGTRVYAACRDGGPPRKATTGPVFNHRGKAYQTTVRHIFFRSGNTSEGPSQPSFQSDLVFEDSDEDDADDPPLSSDELANTESIQYEEPGSSSHQDVSNAPLSNQGEFYVEMKEKETFGEGGGPEIPQGATLLGSAMRQTVEGAHRAVDCALIEVQSDKNADPNLISYDRFDNSKTLHLTNFANLEKMPSGSPVLIATSSGPVRGKLCTTLAFFKPKYQRESLPAYPLTLNDGEALREGDCGSVAVHIKEEQVSMLGHVLFGHPGTVYILPIDIILRDMAEVLRWEPGEEDIVLHPGPRRTHKLGNVRTEFASPKFYQGLGGPLMPKRHPVRGLLGKVVEKIDDVCARASRVMERRKGVAKVQYSFQDLFFCLPPELRNQVIGYLTFREAMSLRHVSRQFRDAVSVNGHAISGRFLVSNPLPPLAQKLYPNNSPDLHHIHMVGHYHAVAWRLADHMAQWLRDDMYLYGSRYQQDHFHPKKIRIKQRLLPSLLLLGRFFEVCREFLENGRDGYGDEIQEGPINFPSKERVTNRCNNELIVQTQDIALVLSTFLQRTLSPPSKYGSAERAVRALRHRPHLPTKPLAREEIAGVLYHGGLEEIVNILDLGSLDRKLAAVRAYCDSPPSLTRDWPSSDGLIEQGTSHRARATRSINLREILTRLPDWEQVWCPSTENAIGRREVIQAQQHAVILKQLIVDGYTRADGLYREGHDLWHALSDNERRGRTHPHGS